MIHRAGYEAALKAKFIPSTVVATRPTTPHKKTKMGWSRGKRRNLRHNCWLIATADPAKKRKEVEHLVSFDSFIDFPRRALSDNVFNGDRLTKKILVLSCLTIGPRERGSLDATYVAQLARKFDWILRYRLAEGYSSFADIPAYFASDLSMRLQSGGVLSLVPVEVRLESLALHERAVPLCGVTVDWDKLSATLGVTTASIARSRDFRLALIESAPGLEEAAVAAIRRTLEAEDDPEEPSVPEKSEETDYEEDGLPPAMGLSSDAPVKRRLKGYLEILEFLFRLSQRELEHDRMETNPFQEVSLDSLLTRDEAPGERTATVLPQDMLRAMVAAARFVASYSNYVISSLLDMRSAELAGVSPSEHDATRRLRPPDGVRVLLAWTYGRSRDRNHNAILLGEAVKHLLAACAILIAGFAARRDIGVRSAHVGCLSENDAGLLEMSIYIGKTDKNRVDVPVPRILKMVVSVLEDLSSDTRVAKGTEWLFEVAFDVDTPDRLISSRFHQTIDSLLNFLKVPPPDGQDRWDLSIHKLRRGYGVWYYYGLTGANVDALSIMYRHEDPHMTRIYFTLVLPGQINRIRSELDARLRSSVGNRPEELQDWIDTQYDRLSYLKSHQQAFDEPRCEIFVEKMIGIWRGTDSVIGAGGMALFNDVQAIAERAMGSIRIGSRVNDPAAIEIPLKERLLEYAKRNFLEPVLGTNMWCRAHPHNEEHLAKAECLKIKGRGSAPWKEADLRPKDLMPDYDFASNPVCIGCPFCAAFNDGQRALYGEIEQRRHVAQHAATSSLKKEAEVLLAELEEAVFRAGPPSKRVLI